LYHPHFGRSADEVRGTRARRTAAASAPGPGEGRLGRFRLESQAHPIHRSKPLLAGLDSIKKLFDDVIDYTPISGGGWLQIFSKTCPT
jgi:hypothetical protein